MAQTVIVAGADSMGSSAMTPFTLVRIKVTWHHPVEGDSGASTITPLWVTTPGGVPAHDGRVVRQASTRVTGCSADG